MVKYIQQFRGNMTFDIVEQRIGKKFTTHKIFFEHWAQLFQENLGTCRLALKLEGTLQSMLSCLIYQYAVVC